MLSQSNINIAETLQNFKDAGLNVSFLVPTETGLKKSIMDAHESLRDYLSEKGIHNFEAQKQGPENKRLIPTVLLSKNHAAQTKTSLYRPTTKNGDPRIWIYGLSPAADAGDLLAIFGTSTELVVINCTTCNLAQLLSRSHPIIGPKLPETDASLSASALELLGKLHDIYLKGYIRTKRPGDTGVGFTLESLLGIEANSSQSPDYKGIELKSSREGKSKRKQTTIFSQVPNWSMSTLKGSKDIMEKHGRYNVEKQRNQIYHEISATKPNSYNLQLVLDESEDRGGPRNLNSAISGSPA